MPSYQLVKTQNLGDVQSSDMCLSNLKVGTMSIQDFDDVRIDGGTLKNVAMRLRTEATAGAFLTVQDSLDGKLGNLVWSDEVSSSWPLNDTIDISKFANDANYITSSDVSSFGLSGNFRMLTDVPTFAEYISTTSNNYAALFLKPENNLSELAVDIDLNIDEYDCACRHEDHSNDTHIPNARVNLGIGALASYNLDDDVEIEDITCTAFRYGNELLGTKGHLLQLQHDNNTTWTQAFSVNKLLTYTHENVDNDDTIDDYNRVDKAVSVSTFSNIYGFVNNLTRVVKEEKIEKFAEELVQELTTNYLNDTLDGWTNLGEQEKNTLIRKFGIGNMAFQDADDVTVERLTVTGKLTFASLISSSNTIENFEVIDNLPLIVTVVNPADQVLTVDHVPLANLKDTTSGLVYVGDGIFSEATHCNDDLRVGSLATFYSFRDIYLEEDVGSSNPPTVASFENEVDNIAISLLGSGANTLTLEDISSRYLDIKFEQYSNLTLDEKTNFNNALGLQSVAFDGDFSSLDERPTTLYEFFNDQTLLDTMCRVENASEAFTNLGCATISLQNANDVFIEGGDANVHLLEIDHALFIESGASDQERWASLGDAEGTLQWSTLHYGSDTRNGLVKTISSSCIAKAMNPDTTYFDQDEYNMVLTVKSIRLLDDLIQSKIDDCQAVLDDIVREFGLSTNTNPIF